MNGYLQNRVMLALVASGLLLTTWPNAHCVFAQEEIGVSESESDSSLGTDELVEESDYSSDLDAPNRSGLSEEFQDASFARYVDLRLVGEAIDARDAALLTDVALQLAEGERILLRNHKSGLTAKKLMGKAAKLAGDSQDKASLERLAKAAAATKDSDLIAEMQAGQKLAGASRASDPALTVSLETTDIDTLSNVVGWIDAVCDAELLGDKAQLQSLHEEIGQAEGLSEAQQKAIAKHIDQATAAAAEADEQDPVLVKLAGESRKGEKVDNAEKKGFFDRASAYAYSLKLQKDLRLKHRGNGWNFTQGVKSYKEKKLGISYTRYMAWARAQWDSPFHG